MIVLTVMICFVFGETEGRFSLLKYTFLKKSWPDSYFIKDRFFLMSTCNKKSHWTRAMQCSKLTTCLYILQRTYRVTSRVRDQTILFANLSPCRIFEQELFWIWRLQQNLVHNTNVARTTPKSAMFIDFQFFGNPLN